MYMVVNVNFLFTMLATSSQLILISSERILFFWLKITSVVKLEDQTYKYKAYRSQIFSSTQFDITYYIKHSFF